MTANIKNKTPKIPKEVLKILKYIWKYREHFRKMKMVYKEYDGLGECDFFDCEERTMFNKISNSYYEWTEVIGEYWFPNKKILSFNNYINNIYKKYRNWDYR